MSWSATCSPRPTRPGGDFARSFVRFACANWRPTGTGRVRPREAEAGLLVSIDPLDAERRYTLEPAHELTPERIFDRTWALTLLDRVVERLRGEYDDAGQATKFEELIVLLTRDPASETYSKVAESAGDN